MDENLEYLILYKILNVDKNATQSEIKKNYYKLAKLNHPDKNQNTEESKNNFQKLNQAYKILSDADKRKIYDRTGEYMDSDNYNIDGFINAYKYFRSYFKEINIQDIDDYKQEYVNSKQEIDDIIEIYNSLKGNMTYFLEHHIFSTNENIPKYIDTIDNLIKDKKITKYLDKYNKTKDKIKKLKIEKHLVKKEKDNFNNLKNAILKKNKDNSEDYLSYLEDKYKNKKKIKKSKVKK